MEKEIVGAAATIIAALVTLLGAIYTHRKTAENAKVSESSRDELVRISRESEERHSRSLSLLNSRLEQAVHKANSIYSRKLEILSGAFNILGEISFLVESYLTPYIEHSGSGRAEKMEQACAKFEDLRKYHMANSIFFDSEDVLGESMGKIMEELNRINNLNTSSGTNQNYWLEQVDAFQTVIKPAVESVKEQFQRTLELSD
ncbi:hypothetical protein GCM10025856_21940 [Methylophaga marina]|uniref:Uncharacterized protein n=1 Tax=Methylophaga marina TaxID=45495 RepID=A0ABN0TNJ8_9GAMM|nr:hypothetical protein [Methylophaga marina]BDZ74475.1 hypothetical protein GCM10025856_21940 [Methylophaga marina]